jgi:predicted dinucleotide-binding enzyme
VPPNSVAIVFIDMAVPGPGIGIYMLPKAVTLFLAVILPEESIVIITVVPCLICSVVPDCIIVKFAVENDAATKPPLASLATIVEAPFELEAVVRAFAIVPLDIFEALIAEIAAPEPDTAVNEPVPAVTTFALNEPLVSRATIVEASLAEAAVVLALASVPEAILDALIDVRAAPLPDIEVVVIAFAVKFPEASRATIVEAPLAEAAVVRAFAIVPALILEALIEVMVKPAPVKLTADTLPV